MKTKSTICSIFLTGVLLSLLLSCQKNTLPVVLPSVTIADMSNVTATSAVTGGLVSYYGGGTITARGVCYSTKPNPTLSDNKSIDGTGIGSFTSNLTGLLTGTTYYIAAYATNGAGTSYSTQTIFSTLPPTSVVTTTSLSGITASSIIGGGVVTDDGGSAIVARGVCWSKLQNPTLLNSRTSDGKGKGPFSSLMTGLKPGTVYYVRAYSTNSGGTSYGDQVTATTLDTLANVTTTAVSRVLKNSATCGGMIFSDGGADIIAKGVCWSQNPYPVITDNITNDGTGSGSFASTISGLAVGSTYYIRAYATNSYGTAYGNQDTISTTIAVVGQNYQGGIVFYIDKSGQHGLIAAPSDQGTAVPWWNGTNLATGATGISVGTGQANTRSIIATQGVGNFAARVCVDLTLNGYSDWFLPSKDELNLMYVNIGPGEAGSKVNVGGFSSNIYWSSSEANTDTAWSQLFQTSRQDYNYKSYQFSVRAVRAF